MMHTMIKPIGAPAVQNNMPNNNLAGMGPGPMGPDSNQELPRKRFFGYRRFHNPMREYTIKSASLPLEEAAKLEMSRPSTAENNKTAVNIIQEILSRRSIIPTYEILPVEGSLNEPLYQYKLTLDSGTKKYVGIGGGKSKKEAKQNTARSVLNQLLGVKDDTPQPVKSSVNKDTNHVNGVSNGNKLAKLSEPNPISLLQESCFARRWPPPYYETDSPNGMPHERQYTTSVYVDKFREVGTGKTKKLAKKEAAKRMLNVLKSVPISPVDYKKLYEDNITSQNISNQKGFDPVQYLHEISQDQRFEITFVEIEDKSLSGQFQALVQLATYPVAVCHGQGKTQQEAKTVAAHNAIEYLRLMTKSK